MGWTAIACAADVEVIKSGAVKTELDLSGLVTGGGEPSRTFRKTLESDLVRSGWFTLGARRTAAIEVSGRCDERGQRLRVDCRVTNRARGNTHLAEEFTDAADRPVRLAHRVADAIVKAVKGVPGIAATRIVMIGSMGTRKDVYLCDANGAGLKRVTHDGAVCLSPTWSPDGNQILYTSYHKGYPDLYRIDVGGGSRSRVAAYPGINAGADVSPDGRRIVLTLSKDGNPDLYVKSLRSRTLVRVTRTPYAAEASPSWSPDGSRIVFVSDRSGRPNLYIQAAAGGAARRLTYEGVENVSPDWGPDGCIAYCSRRDGAYQVYVYSPESKRHTRITKDHADYEDPSWAPDGRHLVCTRSSSYHSDLYVLDVLGDAPVRLTRADGEWHSPSWSPVPGK